MNNGDQQAVDAAYAAQIKQRFDGIYTDLVLGTDPKSPAFDDLLRRAAHGVAQAKYVKGVLAKLLED